MSSQQKPLHRIVVVGGGAGGLELASSLGKKLGKKGEAEITLIDAAQTHVWKPLLHEIAAGTLDSVEEVGYLSQAYHCHFRFRLGKMEGLDRASKTIFVSPTYSKSGEQIIPQRTFSYDTLVIAVGSVSNSFGIPGVDQHCMFLDSTKEAFKFQRQLVDVTIKTLTNNPGKPLSVAIVGAGATGVELSAEIHEVAKHFAIYGLQDQKAKNPLKITIIEGADRLLPALPEKLAAATQQQLTQLGIELKLGHRVVEVTENAIKTHDGETIPADIKVWAAGIKGGDWLNSLDGLESNKINQLVVDQCLKTTIDDDIFAIGDCTACPWPDHPQNVPPRAQAAHQQASTLHKSLVNRIQGKALIPYTYRDYGSLVSLGKYSTVGNLMGNLMGSVSIGGLIARVVYLTLYKMHQVAIHGIYRTVLLTLSNLFRRTAQPRIKLH
ncbi:MAG: NAD(P)/FAD-dependent oxidoreductase [Methylococcaceae bacterium]